MPPRGRQHLSRMATDLGPGAPVRGVRQRGRHRYSFYRRSSTEAYRHIVRVFPVLLDSSRADSLFWGYPWDIEDLVPDEAGDMLATFEHDLIYDGVDYPRPWQRRMPAVLFAGRTTQPQLTVSALPFEPAALSALRRRALD